MRPKILTTAFLLKVPHKKFGNYVQLLMKEENLSQRLIFGMKNLKLLTKTLENQVKEFLDSLRVTYQKTNTLEDSNSTTKILINNSLIKRLLEF